MLIYLNYAEDFSDYLNHISVVVLENARKHKILNFNFQANLNNPLHFVNKLLEYYLKASFNHLKAYVMYHHNV